MIKGDIYDSSFLGIDRVTMSKVASVILREAYPLERLEIEGLLDLIKAAKTCEQYGISVDACLYGLKKFGGNEGFVSAMLPILTSLYRRMGRPELAISAAENYVAQYNARYSVALLTSLAAAYCDIGDYATAKRVADAAYAKQGGGTGEKTELSLVYMRIQKLMESRVKIHRAVYFPKQFTFL